MKTYLVKYGASTYSIENRGPNTQIVAALVSVASGEWSYEYDSPSIGDMDCSGPSVTDMGFAVLKAAEWLHALPQSAGVPAVKDIITALNDVLSKEERERLNKKLASAWLNVEQSTCAGPLWK